MARGADAGLERAIGARQLTASIINSTIGAGIFVLPLVAAAGLGAAVPGGPGIPILAAAVILWLLTSATRREFGVEALAVASMFYLIRKAGGQL